MGHAPKITKPRVLGIDPASRNAGLAVVEGDKLIDSAQILIPKHSTTEELMAGLMYFSDVVGEWIAKLQPALLVVEHTSVFRNMNTTKLLTYFEAMALIRAGRAGILAERARTKPARKAVCGNGNLDKAGVTDWVFRKYNRSFGEDEAEAIVFALYGYGILS